jgi:hypothetical protein
MDQLSAELRESGSTWVQVAGQFRRRWNLSARQSFREAHRLTQSRVTETWNSLWPDDPLTVRKLGAWEAWPNRTGNEPPMAALNKLARIYQCQTGDLVDGEDHGAADEHAARHTARPGRSIITTSPSGGPLRLGNCGMLSSTSSSKRSPHGPLR